MTAGPAGATYLVYMYSNIAIDFGRAATIADAAYVALRNAIVFGELPAGHRLLERELALRLAVSRTPIREALRRLSEEGLVSGVPNRGFVVRTVGLQEAEHVYTVRQPLEVLAAQLAAGRCTPRDLAELEGCLVRAERAAAAGDWRTVIQENNAFHDLIARASGNPVLTRMLDLLRNQVNLVRMALWARMPSRPTETLRQHREILEALRRRDPQAAGAAAQAHLRSSWRSLWQALQKEGSGREPA